MGTVIGFVMMLFLMFFFLRDGASMEAHLIALVPMPLARKQQLITYLASVTRAVVFGTLLTGLLQGALVGIGFGIVHLPSPLVFAVIAALLSLLPIGGTALVWVPAALYLLAQGRYGAAIFLTIWGALLVGLMDNLLKPLLISGQSRNTDAGGVPWRRRRAVRFRAGRHVPRTGAAGDDDRGAALG